MRCVHEWVGGPIPTCKKCGKQPHASPSQLETWKLCRRKWKYGRLRTAVPAKQSATDGQTTHLFLEHYIKDGLWTAEIAGSKWGKWLTPGLPYFPAPKQGLAEREVYRPLMGYMWSIKIDSTDQWRPGVSVRVSDLKTTRDFKWAKTEDDLREDTQRIVYAYEIDDMLHLEQVEAQWVYVLKNARRPEAKPVSITEKSSDTADRFRDITEYGVKPMVAANAVPVDEFPRDGLSNGGCGKFGGCEYKDICLGAMDPDELILISIK